MNDEYRQNAKVFTQLDLDNAAMTARHMEKERIIRLLQEGKVQIPITGETAEIKYKILENVCLLISWGLIDAINGVEHDVHNA